MIFVAEIYAAVDPEGTEQRLLFSTIPFHTGGGGSPANTPAYGRLMQPANFERSIASGKLIFGLTETGYGECVVANADGAFDILSTYGVDGRQFNLWASEQQSSVLLHETFYIYGGWVRILRCTMQSIVADGDVLRVRLRERFFELNQKACPVFAGTGGVEGTSDMTGQPKPMIWGGAYNVSPVLLSPSYLTYLVSATGSMAGNHLKDSGSVVARQLTSGAQENDAAANFAALQGLSITVGHYATHATSGTLKLGSPPVGQVTVDALSTVSADPAEVIKAILNSAGIATSGVYSQIDASDFSAVSTWASGASSRVGIYARDTSTTYGQLISALAASIGAWIGYDRWGTIRIAIVVDPSGRTSALSIGMDDVISIKRTTSGDAGRGVPFKSITQKYPRNWTPQNSGLAGVVTARVRGEIAEEFPLSTVTTCEQLSSSPPATIAITDQFTKAVDYPVDSYGIGRRVTSTGALEATVPAPGSQFSALLGVPRDWIEVVIPFRITDFEAVEIGGCVTVTHPRYGLEDGKKFMVVAIRYSLAGNPTATLTLWG